MDEKQAIQEAFKRAVFDNQFETAKKFIEERTILPEADNIYVWSLLVEVIDQHRNDIATLILEIGSQFKTGISVHAKIPPEYGSWVIEGQTPLHLAANAGNSEMVSYCLEKGASIAEQDANNKTPLAVTAEYKVELEAENLEESTSQKTRESNQHLIQKLEAAITLLKKAPQPATPTTPKLGRDSPVISPPTPQPLSPEEEEKQKRLQRLQDARK